VWGWWTCITSDTGPISEKVSKKKKKKKKEKKKTDIPERGFDLSADRSSQGTTGHDSEEEEKKKKEKTNENNNDNGSSNSNKKTKQNKAGPSH
jgi:hypothetical protein